MNIYLKNEKNEWKFFKNLEKDSKELEKRQIKIGNSAYIGDSAKIGEFAEIGNATEIGEFAEIRDCVEIGDCVKIGGCAEIGKNAYIGNFARIKQHIKIADYKIITVVQYFNKNRIIYYANINPPDKISLGCFSRTVQEWEEDFNNNIDEFPIGSPALQSRKNAYQFCKKDLEIYNKEVKSEHIFEK